jgi:uncharacterized protein YdaU (DUF1376 family)
MSDADRMDLSREPGSSLVLPIQDYRPSLTLSEDSMSNAPIYIRLHIADYERDTGDLTAGENGIYLRLLMVYYSTARPLPGDREKIYRRVKAICDAERKITDNILDKFFSFSEGVYKHRRVDEELSDWKNRTESSKTSANERWKIKPLFFNETIDANASDSHMPNRCERNANKKLKTTPITPFKKPRTKKLEGPLPPDFALTDKMRAWAKANNISRVEDHFAYYRDYCVATDRRKKDFEADFRNAMRGNWAKCPETASDKPRRLAL